MKRLAIIGAGDLGVQIAHYAPIFAGYEVVGFFDDTIMSGTTVSEKPVLGLIAQVTDSFHADVFDSLFIAVGYNHLSFRESVFERFSPSIPFANMIHASSSIDPTVSMGQGVIVHPGCTVSMGAVIGDNVTVNNGSHLAHDSIVGPHSFVSASVSVAGYAKVGKRVYLGIGSIVSDNLSVCDDCFIGAGAVVVSDLTEPGVYVGCPARFLRKR